MNNMIDSTSSQSTQNSCNYDSYNSQIEQDTVLKTSSEPKNTELEVARDDQSSQAGLLEELGDVADTFWDQITGTAARTIREAGDSTAQAVDKLGAIANRKVDEVRADINDAWETLRSPEFSELAINLLDQELPGAGELMRRTVEVDREYAHALEELIEQHPVEMVAELAEAALNNDWPLATEIAITLTKKGVNPTVDFLGQSADIAVKAARVLTDKKTDVVNDLKADILRAGCNFVVDHAEIAHGLAELGADILEHPLTEALVSFQKELPWGYVVKASHNAAIALTHAADGIPEFADMLLKNEPMLRLVAGARDYRQVARELEDLPIGGPGCLRESNGLKVEAFAELGGELSGSIAGEARRTGEQTYEVDLSIAASALVGGGISAQGKGAKAAGGTKIGGKLTVEFKGPDAAENAARLLFIAAKPSTSLLELTELLSADSKILYGDLGIGSDVSISAAAAEFRGGTFVSTTRKSVDDVQHTGLSGALKLSLGAETDYIQLGNPISDAWMNDPDTGYPFVNQVMEMLPDNLVTDIKKVYGPRAGIAIKGEAEISAQLLTPEGEPEPLHLELEVSLGMMLGASEGAANYKVIIPDLGKLAGMVGMDAKNLAEKLATGALPIDDLTASVGHLDSLIQTDGPTITMNQTHQMLAYDIVGIQRASGRVESLELWKKPNNTDFLANLQASVDGAAPENSADTRAPENSADTRAPENSADSFSPEAIRQYQLAAHARRL